VWFGGSGTITGNALKRIGAWEGLPGLTSSGAGTQGNQDDQYEGILLQSSNGITCSLNTIDSTGYNGIKHYGSNITIEKNVINFPCVTKSDGGGIYCWDNDGTLARTNRRVKNNIVLNSGKFLYGVSTPGLNTASYGIYFDGGSNGALCDSNVIGPNVYNQNSRCNNPTNTSDDAGLMLNGGTNLTLRGNIVFGWPDALEIWKPASCCVPTNNRIVGNALYVNGGGTDLCTWNQSLQYHRIDNSTIAQIQTQVQALGVIDSNFVSDFAPSPYTYKSQAVNPGGPVSLAAWRTYSGKDVNTQSFPNTTPDFQYNATNTPRTYSFPGLSKKDFRGVVYNNSAIIPPFYGNIFFPNGNATGGTPLSVSNTATTIACNGGNSIVTVSATGGTAPYTGTGTFTRTAGTYTFTVTDAVGGSATTSVTITQPIQLAATVTSGTISTNGGTTNITVNANGGTASYTYSLNSGSFQSSNIFSGVTAGSYTITIKDANNCTLVKNIIITQPNVLIVTATATAIACNGGNSTVTVSATGGTPPYTGIGTFTRPAGTHTFTITDAAGASAFTSVTVTQPTALAVTADATPITCVGGNSTITMSAAGGTAPYTGTGSFIKVVGTHTLVVTDAAGCSVSTTATLSDPQVVAPIISVGSVTSSTLVARAAPVQIRTVLASESGLSAIIYPNPTQDYFNLDLKTKSKKAVSVFVYTIDGKLIFQVTGQPKNRYKFGEALPNGIYIAKIIQGTDERIIEIIKG
jgi:hypothetical protein